MRAAIGALKGAELTVNLQRLEKTALSVSQCEKILAESREGETRLAENEESRQHFRKSLGLLPAVTRCETQRAAPKPEMSKRAKGKRVGQRDPHRDIVGQTAVALA